MIRRHCQSERRIVTVETRNYVIYRQIINDFKFNFELEVAQIMLYLLTKMLSTYNRSKKIIYLCIFHVILYTVNTL